MQTIFVAILVMLSLFYVARSLWHQARGIFHSNSSNEGCPGCGTCDAAKKMKELASRQQKNTNLPLAARTAAPRSQSASKK